MCGGREGAKCAGREGGRCKHNIVQAVGKRSGTLVLRLLGGMSEYYEYRWCREGESPYRNEKKLFDLILV